MQEIRVGVIGTGRPWRTEGATGMGIANNHMTGYKACPEVRLSAFCDLDVTAAEAFRDTHAGPESGAKCYSDYRQMLAESPLDMVSVCTWPGTHAEMVVACAEAGVKIIHCEKPMAPTWAEAKRMAEACDRAGAQLTFNHQRRFDPAYVKAREILRSGRVGKLVRLEMPTGNMFDWGTHWLDMMHFWNDETPAEWVQAAAEPTGGQTIFRVLHEGLGLVHIKFQNGVHAYMPTGDHGFAFQCRLVGEKGAIEIGFGGWDWLRVRADNEPAWESIDTKQPAGELDGFGQAILDAIACHRAGVEPELSSKKAMRATELIFAAYHSANTGRRVTLPLDVDDVAIRAEPA